MSRLPDVSSSWETHGVAWTVETVESRSLGDQGRVEAEQGVFLALEAADNGSNGDNGRFEAEEGVF